MKGLLLLIPLLLFCFNYIDQKDPSDYLPDFVLDLKDEITDGIEEFAWDLDTDFEFDGFPKEFTSRMPKIDKYFRPRRNHGQIAGRELSYAKPVRMAGIMGLGRRDSLGIMGR